MSKSRVTDMKLGLAYSHNMHDNEPNILIQELFAGNYLCVRSLIVNDTELVDITNVWIGTCLYSKC